MKTRKTEVKVGMTILLEDGTVDIVEDYDGSFYYLKDSDEPISHHTLVDEIVAP